jgi:hypothetical protein
MSTTAGPFQIRLLNATYEPLLKNVPLVLKECAVDEMCMDIINDPEHQLDGVRLLWSLLKHSNNEIKRNACLSLVPCIRYAKDSPEMIRAFMGSLELVADLLESDNTEVLSAVCAIIAEIAADSENLGILTDHGVVKKLASLVEIVSLALLMHQCFRLRAAASRRRKKRTKIIIINIFMLL